jgi:hypothetical protein
MLRSAYSPDGLSAIYSEHVNVAEWRRDLSAAVGHYAANMVQQFPSFSLRQVVPADVDSHNIFKHLPGLAGNAEQSQREFAKDLALLCDMYACLFDVDQIGLRLSVLNKAMCPRFHVDHVVCRMICTYWGPGTEWLPEVSVNRKAVDRMDNNSEAISTEEYQNETNIQRLGEGCVALLKGEKWPGNEGRGLVHRSPAASADWQSRNST